MVGAPVMPPGPVYWLSAVRVGTERARSVHALRHVGTAATWLAWMYGADAPPGRCKCPRRPCPASYRPRPKRRRSPSLRHRLERRCHRSPPARRFRSPRFRHPALASAALPSSRPPPATLLRRAIWRPGSGSWGASSLSPSPRFRTGRENGLLERRGAGLQAHRDARVASGMRQHPAPVGLGFTVVKSSARTSSEATTDTLLSELRDLNLLRLEAVDHLDVVQLAYDEVGRRSAAPTPTPSRRP